MRYQEEEVVNALVAWVRRDADLDELAAFWSEFRPDEIVSVRRADGGESGQFISGKPYRKEVADA